MALYKRNGIWWVDITHQGTRVRESTGTASKVDAQQFHDKFKSDLWRQANLQIKPEKSWMDAVVRWLDEAKHKRSLFADKIHLRWMDSYLRGRMLREVD